VIVAAARAVAARDAEWAAPPLWSSEVLSALGSYVKRGDVSVADASDMYSGATDAIGDRGFDPEPAEVLELAARSGCSTYDCEYVAVARAVTAPGGA
jgi:predicted nucleic acid-binding protein